MTSANSCALTTQVALNKKSSLFLHDGYDCIVLMSRLYCMIMIADIIISHKSLGTKFECLLFVKKARMFVCGSCE